MIYGVGTDIVDIERIKYILTKNKGNLVERVLTEHERALFLNYAESASYVAKRFAAKEAFAKALGVGIGGIVSFQDLTVRADENGKPTFQVSEKLRQYLLEKNIKTAHLSLSDEKHYATAFVVLEKVTD